jgi:hypothetical protein
MPISDYLTPEDLQIMLDETYGNQQTQDFIRPNPLQFQYPFIPGGIMNTGSVMYDEFPPDFSFRPQVLPSQGIEMDTSYGVANEPDVEQVESLTEEAPNQGLAYLRNFLPGNLFGTLLSGILPKDPPEVRAIKDFYAKNYGVNTAGSVASGIMQGYNPVSGGFLNMITGGKYGKPMQVGLADAARRRIENIAKRRAPQTEASRAKIAELQRIAERDTITRARAAAPDVYREADRQGFTGPGGGFSTTGGRDSGFESASSNPSGRGRQDY